KNELQARQQANADGKTLAYFCVTGAPPAEADPNARYIFQTDTLAPDVVGYGGAITLAIVVEADGTLQDVRVLRSDETPSYLDFLKPWMQRLLGGNLFAPDPLKNVDAVTGATLTTSAIIRILRKAGKNFGGKALGLAISPTAQDERHPAPYKATLWLALASVIALVLRARPSQWLRRGFLVLILVLSGFVFNMQYSLDHVFSLFELTIPPFGWGTAFLLVVGVPALVILFGNVYCGYLCPFGALQELVGDMRPASLRTDPDKAAWAYGRFVKYLLLALMTLLFATTLESALASSDPLVTVFAHERSRLLLCLTGLLVGLAFFYPRFWCRTLCPTGAFLSLMNGIRLLRRLTPATLPHACVYGVRESHDLDCLCCDRCRQPGRQEQLALTRSPDWVAARLVNTVLLTAAAALAVTLAVQTTATWRNEVVGARTRGQAEMIGRGARPVDMKQLRYLIEQGKLSDREARFYKTAPSGPPHP
ncbi:MAG: 4Fe-4S binding protein, partial [Kiritimatiellota bacterium]|nr:4Fe-4S binding protein [Kiritimatiellota bacterium]